MSSAEEAGEGGKKGGEAEAKVGKLWAEIFVLSWRRFQRVLLPSVGGLGGCSHLLSGLLGFPLLLPLFWSAHRSFQDAASPPPRKVGTRPWARGTRGGWSDGEQVPGMQWNQVHF